MGQIKVSLQQPPKLGNGVYYKDLKFKDQNGFIRELTDWISTFVSRHRAPNLILEAAGLEEVIRHIKHAPVSMQLGGKTWRVHVEFFWGRTSNHQWWVSGLGFHIKDSLNNIAAANLAAERERLRDIYEERQALAGIPARKAFFEIEKYSNDFDGDLFRGKAKLNEMVEEVFGLAKEMAKMPTNPIGPDPNDPISILTATLGAAVSVGTGEVIGAAQRAGSVVPRSALAGGEKMVNTLRALGYEPRYVYEVLHKAAELGDKVKGRISDNSGVAALADLIEIGLSFSTVAGPFAPLASIILGSFIEILIANEASHVSRVRSHMYACYAAGVVDGLILGSPTKLERPGDKVFYELGAKRAAMIKPENKYNLQVALMEYVLRQPIGEWNLNPMFTGKPPFPSAYIRYWSPEMLKRGIMIKLCRPKYLYK